MNQSIFSLLSAIVLIFNKCLTPTFSDTEFPPHDPQPNVNDGSNLKLNTSPIAPRDAGIFINVLPVFILLPNISIFSFSAGFTYITDVCPNPPNSIKAAAFSIDASNPSDLVIPKIGDNFSCADSSSNVAFSISAINTLANLGTSNPANFAIAYALLPTISGFNAPATPFLNNVFLNLSFSSSVKKYAPLNWNSLLTLSYIFLSTINDCSDAHITPLSNVLDNRM